MRNDEFVPGDAAIIERLDRLTKHVMYLEVAVKRLLTEGAPVEVLVTLEQSGERRTLDAF